VLGESTVFIGKEEEEEEEELWKAGFLPCLPAANHMCARIIRQTMMCDVDLTMKMRRKLLDLQTGETGSTRQW
jgi:hypothetical protein